MYSSLKSVQFFSPRGVSHEGNSGYFSTLLGTAQFYFFKAPFSGVLLCPTLIYLKIKGLELFIFKKLEF